MADFAIEGISIYSDYIRNSNLLIIIIIIIEDYINITAILLTLLVSLNLDVYIYRILDDVK